MKWTETGSELLALNRAGDLLTMRQSPEWFWCRKWDTFLGAVRTRAEAEKLCASGRPLDTAYQEDELRKYNFKWRDDKKGVLVATEIPDGEAFYAKIETTSRSTDGVIRFYSYRNGRALGTSATLDEAKKLCCAGVARASDMVSRNRVKNYVENHAGDVDEFERLSDAEKRYVKWMHTKAAPKEYTYTRLRLDPVTGEYKPAGIIEFKEMKRLRKPKEPKEPKAPREPKLAQSLDKELTIYRIKDSNPKKVGTGAHERWEFLFKHAGKQIIDYAQAKGNMTTLANAIKMGYVEVK